jgi:predicted RNA polymerase sigma factor
MTRRDDSLPRLSCRLVSPDCLGLMPPADVGGSGLGPRTLAVVTATLAEADASVAMVYVMHILGILALYELLKQVAPSPMVTLNHAIAAAMVHGPAKGLELLRALDRDPRIAAHYRLDAVRAHLLEKMGDHEAAINHYRVAAARTTSMPERNYLMTQAARLAAD